MVENHGTVHEIAQNRNQLIVVAGLEILPCEVVVLGLGSVGCQRVAQCVLLAGEVPEVFVKPYGPVARGRYLVILQIEELVGGYVVGQIVGAVGHQHRGEHDAVEHDVVLADEMDHACFGILPPFGIVVADEVDGVGDITDGGVKPYVEHLSLGAFYGHGDTPVEVAAHGAGLQAHVEP